MQFVDEHSIQHIKGKLLRLGIFVVDYQKFRRRKFRRQKFRRKKFRRQKFRRRWLRSIKRRIFFNLLGIVLLLSLNSYR